MDDAPIFGIRPRNDPDASVFPDVDHPNDWRVEYQDDDGGCYVTIFAGPFAERRALAYFAALKSGALEL